MFLLEYCFSDASALVIKDHSPSAQSMTMPGLPQREFSCVRVQTTSLYANLMSLAVNIAPNPSYKS